MANIKTNRVARLVQGQEKALVKMAQDLARTLLDGLSLADDKGASDYQKTRCMAPLLKQMGAIGAACELQIEFHDNAAKLAMSIGMEDDVREQSAGPGRDKDGG